MHTYTYVYMFIFIYIYATEYVLGIIYGSTATIALQFGRPPLRACMLEQSRPSAPPLLPRSPWAHDWSEPAGSISKACI